MMKHILGTNCETWFRVMPGFVVVFWQMSKKKSQKKRCLLEHTLVSGVVAYRLEGHLSYFVYIMNTVLIPLYNLADCDAWFVFVKLVHSALPPPPTGKRFNPCVASIYHLERIDGDRHSHVILGFIMAPYPIRHRTWEWRSPSILSP